MYLYKQESHHKCFDQESQESSPILCIVDSEKLGTIIYSLGGGRGWTEILRGALIFGKLPIGGNLFLSRKSLKKPAKPIFLCSSDKKNTKKIILKKFSRGEALIFYGLKNISGPPSTIWPLREAIIYGLVEAGNSDNFREWPYFLLIFLELTCWPPRNPKQSLIFLPLHDASKIFAPPSRHVQNFLPP